MLGKLRDIVTPLTPTSTADAIGGQTVTYVEGDWLYAEVRSKSLSPDMLLSHKDAKSMIVVTMRINSEIDTQCKLRFNGEDYSVVSVYNHPKKYEYQIVEAIL